MIGTLDYIYQLQAVKISVERGESLLAAPAQQWRDCSRPIGFLAVACFLIWGGDPGSVRVQVVGLTVALLAVSQ